MLKNEDIICISSIDWDFIWQQHQEIMSALAKSGNRVLFIENTGVRSPGLADARRLKKRIFNWLKSTKGFRKEIDNLYVYSPMILPFPYFRLARWINRILLRRSLNRWMKVMHFNNPLIWTFLPTPIVLSLTEDIAHKAFVYYCTDNFTATSKSARKITSYERRVLQKADIVFATSKQMTDYCRKFNNNVTRVPIGVNTTMFLNAEKLIRQRPPELNGLGQAIIGYIGGVRQSIDQKLIEYCANKFPEYTFVFIGPIQTNISHLRRLKNVIFLGQKPHSTLPAYIKYFDACIIPYRKDEYTDNISAAKLNEYLIMGKPVVTTNLEEIEYFNRENGNILYIASKYEDFTDYLLQAVRNDNQQLKEKRIQVAMNNSWEKKIRQMSEIVSVYINKPFIEEANWQDKFIKIYVSFRRKALHILLAVVFVWLLLFYTPFMWYLAEPLKLAQPPEKADAIVVFAGGVGESGKAGQGYEERVKYAVELFKQGYSGHLIFSSGYIYTLKEPAVMKAVATSLGVPEQAMILEEEAKNTLENVLYTSEILKRQNWKSILLISSPYHMRRAYLVWKKNAPEIKVTYAPIQQSLFFSHPDKDSNYRIIQLITIAQIKAIVHEYLGLAYYWLRRYI